MTEHLGPDLGAEVQWRAPEVHWNFTPPDGGYPIPEDCDLARLFNDTWNIHKPPHYMPFYDKVCGPYRNRPIRLLEMGVARGGSLELWRKYFCPDAIIVGMDGFEGCTRFNDPDRNIFVRHGHQQNLDNLKSLVEEFGKFDIILDDASHMPSPTLTSFKYLFAQGLNDGGVYMVEDLGLCWCPGFLEPFPDDPQANDGSPNFIDIVKYLIDVMHAHHRQADTKGLDAFQPGNPARMDEFTVPLATTLINGIDIHDGIVAIHRQPRTAPLSLYKGSGEHTNLRNVPDEWLQRQSSSAQEMVKTLKF